LPPWVSFSLPVTSVPSMAQRRVVQLAGRIGSVQPAQDGQSYGFLLYDEQDRPCMYLGFNTRRDADRAAREALGLLVTALTCERR